MQPSKERIKLSPETNRALKALGWDGWEPKMGDWCFYSRHSVLSLATGEPFHRDAYDSHGGMRLGQEGDWINCRPINRRVDLLLEVKSLIPLLHWEQIEPILEGLGYCVQFYGNPRESYECDIWEPCGISANVIGFKTRQIALMKAVILLAKEAKKWEK